MTSNQKQDAQMLVFGFMRIGIDTALRVILSNPYTPRSDVQSVRATDNAYRLCSDSVIVSHWLLISELTVSAVYRRPRSN